MATGPAISLTLVMRVSHTKLIDGDRTDSYLAWSFQESICITTLCLFRLPTPWIGIVLSSVLLTGCIPDGRTLYCARDISTNKAPTPVIQLLAIRLTYENFHRYRTQGCGSVPCVCSWAFLACQHPALPPSAPPPPPTTTPFK